VLYKFICFFFTFWFVNSSVGLCIQTLQDYKSPHVAGTICANLVNTLTDIS